MKILSMLRKLVPSLVRRRVTPSPASMTYWAPLTTSRFDDCARPTVGVGPDLVPNVMRRVPDFGDEAAPLGCAQVRPTWTTATMAMKLATTSHDPDLFMFSSWPAGAEISLSP